MPRNSATTSLTLSSTKTPVTNKPLGVLQFPTSLREPKTSPGSSLHLQISDPIFIVGTGRSGSSVFFEMFACHPEVAWLSVLARDFPDHPWLNKLLLRGLSMEAIRPLLTKTIGPAEAYPFWEANCPGFANPCRDLTADDVTPVAAKRVREAIEGMLSKRRSRFIAKITGWPRMRYLNRIFPGAKFIEMTRDPSAICSSLLEVPFWDGWRGPPTWRRGPLPEDLESIWNEENKSFVALAALEYVIHQRAMDACRKELDGHRVLSISYSSLCRQPVGQFREVTEFCGLPWSTGFERAIGRFRLIDRDDKWRTHLTAGQQTVLLRTLERAQGRPSAPAD
jgi:omega-hydroxy-beta-dihydromenaquinone-9 sulfotransferase